MKIFLTIVFIVVSVILTAIVLMQEGKDAGLGTIGGIGDTYWSKNKSRSMEGNLVKFTKWLAGAFLVLALVLNMIPDKTTTTTAATTTATASTETEIAAAGTEAESGAAAATEAETAAAAAENTAAGTETAAATEAN